jgi:hypothetical protein
MGDAISRLLNELKRGLAALYGSRLSRILLLESGVKIAISGLDRLQSVNLAHDVIGQIL